ncbi:GNAT family N-acetyltransferase [Priestia koreensis]|uniref:GNAT family N-acetyltransferase n=1 Tax=Priestia koreensis TaxID=284581 RepID=UPI003019CC0F
MATFQQIMDLDFAYLETFTKRIQTNWGAIFVDEDNPRYYDANHAHLASQPENSEEVIHEVSAFYESKGIVPRFYLYNTEELGDFKAALIKKGFQYEELKTPVQVWNRSLENERQREEITIERVTKHNKEAAIEIECSIEEFGGSIRREAFEKEFAHPAFVHYILRYNGIACGTACLYRHHDQGRIESVAVLKAYRGKGLVGPLLHKIKKESLQQNIKTLWIFPINESIQRVYEKYGFETVEQLTTGHAYLRGRSIIEIQGT